MQLDHMLAGDASGVGLYLYKSTGDQATLLSAAMSQQESQQSSTFREVLVFHRFYTSLEASRFRGQTLLHLTDNQGAASILAKGSRVEAIHNMAVEVFLACQKLEISLHTQWRRRSEEEMVVADRGSRGPWCGVEEFQLDFNTCAWLVATFNFTIDAFATKLNRKLIQRRAQGVAVFHLWAAAPFYSVFVDHDHLTRMVT